MNYDTKKSIVQDKNAMDTFTRNKSEPIRNCLERCKLVVDKLRHTFAEASWPEMRKFLLKQTLMGLVLPETKNYIITKENHILETTGIHFPINQLVTSIETFESLHSKVPKY